MSSASLSSFQPKGLTFARLAIATLLAGSAAHVLAAERWGRDSAPAAMLMKAAVGAGDATSWSELADTRAATAEFLELVAQRTILGRLAGLRYAPVNVPFVATSDGATAYWTAQGKATPVSRQAFDREVLGSLKVAALTVFSEELLKSADPRAEAMVRNDLVRAAADLMNSSFIDATNTGIAGEMPASVTAGLTPIGGSGNVATDLAALIEAFAGDLDSAYLVTDPTTAAQMGLFGGSVMIACGARGGEAIGIPVITSGSSPRSTAGGQIALLDASSICVVDEGAEIQRAQQAAVEMNSAPAGDTLTPAAASTELVSLFQTESVAALVTRRINWHVARANSVVLLNGALYAGA